MNEKVIVITGVSRGLGRALTRKFISMGHTVWGCSRSSEELKNLKKELGDRAILSRVDIAEMSQVEKWAEDLLSTGLIPDILINNAAVINRNAPLWKVPPSEFECVIDTNIKGIFYTIRAFLPSMLSRQQGVIVNFSSGWGRSTSPEVAPYCATKWAVEGLTQALAQELPPNMSAVPLNPGIIRTEMLESCFGKSASLYPLPEDWADTAANFILSLGPEHNGKPLSIP